MGSGLLPPVAWRDVAHSLHLSPRELQIVKLALDDQCEVAIARHLGISSHTVHTHFERLYRKLSVASRVELVVRIFAEYLAMSPAQPTDQ